MKEEITREEAIGRLMLQLIDATRYEKERTEPQCDASKINAMNVTRLKSQDRILNEISKATRYEGNEDFVQYIKDLMERFDKRMEWQKIDGQGIEYWHRIAISALQTNDHLISRQRELLASLKEKERINADLEQQLRAADITPQRRYRVDGVEVSRNDFWNWVRESPEGIIQDCSDGWMHGTSR
jgi:hypothetical protein